MSRSGKVFFKNEFAGNIEESAEGGYTFRYDPLYLAKEGARPVSLTLPLSKTVYQDKVLFAFFDGLIPEGWLLHIATSKWKLKQSDRMGLLLTACKDCIGAVSVEPILQQESDN